VQAAQSLERERERSHRQVADYTPGGMKRTVGQLIDAEEDAWPDVTNWVRDSIRPAEVLTADPAAGEATLFALQITTRSPMGAIALRAGGVLVDGGWLRILGAGHARVGGGLREWNGLDGNAPVDSPLAGALIVAYDVVGGFFAINGGAWDGPTGAVRYFGPDTRDWQALDLTYTALLRFALLGDLAAFYANLRWPGWEADLATVGPDEAFSFYPWLGFEAESIATRSRRVIPARELWSFNHWLREQVKGLPSGAQVRVTIDDPQSK
jgi:hypothetical protein